MKIVREDRWLIVSFPETQKVLSWAVYGGVTAETKEIVWYQVGPKELKPSVPPSDFIREKLSAKGLPNAVALLTTADLDFYTDVERDGEGLGVRCILTAGLHNALRVGDPPARKVPVGTINLLCRISQPLTENAYLETLAMAVEARTAAVLEAGIPSTQSGKPSTGTGTDCVVIAAPAGSLTASRICYAGKHTVAGSLIGGAVYEAMASALARLNLT